MEAKHRANPTCNACHRFMDPIGLALDNFDVTGSGGLRENGMGACRHERRVLRRHADHTPEGGSADALLQLGRIAAHEEPDART